MHSNDDFEMVRRLISTGLNDCEIHRQTGVPRRTVCDWRVRPPRTLTTRKQSKCEAHDYSGSPSDAYAYLLGMYLGDGYICRSGRVWRLRITPGQEIPGHHR